MIGTETVRLLLAPAALALWLQAAPVSAQIMPVVKDPSENSQRLLKMLEEEGAEPFSAEVMRLLKNEKPNAGFTDQLRAFGKKPADFSAMIYDKTYGEAIRVMLIYKQYDDGRFPFVYYQFTYKMTKDGWAMTNFRFKSDASQAFPEGYAAP